MPTLKFLRLGLIRSLFERVMFFIVIIVFHLLKIIVIIALVFKIQGFCIAVKHSPHWIVLGNFAVSEIYSAVSAGFSQYPNITC